MSWSDTTTRLGLDHVFARFAEKAASRDVERGLVFDEIAELKSLGYGAARLPVADGGLGISLPELFTLTRDLAAADSNIAHVLRNHFATVERQLRTPAVPVSSLILAKVADKAIFGGAFSDQNVGPAGTTGGKTTRLTRPTEGGGYVLNGTKTYSTGNLYSDYLLVSVYLAEQDEQRQVMIPRSRDGVDIADDWVGFGQKLTASGTSNFHDVAVAASELLPADATPGRTTGFYEATFPQLYLTTVISGILQRVLADALDLVATRSRNYYHAQADKLSDEPAIQSVVGRIASYSQAVSAIVDRAVAKLATAFAHRGEPDGQRLSLEASIAATEAKVVTDETAASLASSLIDLASGSSVSTARALDRHWRNIKVISSHNPRIYKERVLGDYYLNGAVPPTGSFF